MNLGNRMRQSQKLNRKLHQGIRVQSVFDLTFHTIKNHVHLLTNILFAKIRDMHQKFAEKNQVIVTYQTFFQYSFRNYPD